MITSVIGKKFLKAYNEKYATNYDAKTFFVEKYYPLFYGYKKYAQWITNSPFVQGLESSQSGEYGVAEIIKDSNGKTKKFQNKEGMDLYIETEIKPKIGKDILELKEKKTTQIKILKPLNETELDRIKNSFMNKVRESKADASIAIGYPSLDVMATTSGQVSNIDCNTLEEDIYLSWIGSCLCIGTDKGYAILFDNKELLLDIYEGWMVYRQALNNNAELKGNQINTWNGQWLVHRYSNMYVESFPMANFNPFSTKDGIMSVDIQSWTKILIAISKHYRNPQMMGYVSNLGKSNITIGFIPFALNQIRRPIELYNKLFGIEEGKKAETLYGTAFGFDEACKQGTIGVKAMEPKDLKQYMLSSKNKQGKIILPKTPNYSSKNQEEIINYHTYQIWLLAMLNNEEAWAKAREFAKELQNYAQSGEKGKTGNSRKVDAVMESTNKVNFIKALVDIVADAENKDKIEGTTALVNTMPADNVPYFLTLVRFHYAAINNINSKK